MLNQKRFFPDRVPIFENGIEVRKKALAFMGVVHYEKIAVPKKISSFFLGGDCSRKSLQGSFLLPHPLVKVCGASQCRAQVEVGFSELWIGANQVGENTGRFVKTPLLEFRDASIVATGGCGLTAS